MKVRTLMKDKVILHSDLNNFYASVECLHNPKLRGKPVAVCGDAELRHGIVLAKNYIAKSYGIKTGDVIWEAKLKCPKLITISANFNQYLRFSQIVRHIYENYTDQIESFGIDECWLDVSGQDGALIADDIRRRITFEAGITASVGVSWNKIFAKLGSDMKKPDATTIISKENYKETIWNLPAKDLLYVGKATEEKLRRINIKTIDELAQTDVELLKLKLGKWGEYIWTFANGYDTSPVEVNGAEGIIKSVGNSTTTIRDLISYDDVLMIVTVLAESVAARLRDQWLKGQVVTLYLRDSILDTWGKQIKIDTPTFISEEIIDTAMRLYEFYNFKRPIRSVGIKVSNLVSADTVVQTNMFVSEAQRMKNENLEKTIFELRKRFGHFSINRGVEYLDKELTAFNPYSENVIHPISFFK